MKRFPFFLLAATLAVTLFPDAACAQKKAGTVEVTPDFFRNADVKIRALSNDVMPAVVALIPGGQQMRMGTGSGVIVSEDGLILTAAHVAVEMNEKVTVIFPDGNRAEAKVLGMDYSRDAAMLQITEKGDYPFVEIGESASKKRNDFCIAIGHPGGFQADRSPPIRLGRVIKNVDKKEQFLVTDSALNGGDSGGPLFDIDGKLIGIHSNIGFSLSQNRHVPITVFSKEWDRLKKGERFGGSHVGGFLENPDRPVIGAVLDETKGKKGAKIVEMLRNAPAKRAGLKVGDVIVKAGKTEISSVKSLIDFIGKKKPGDVINMTVKSKEDEEQRGVSVKLDAAKKYRMDNDPHRRLENQRFRRRAPEVFPKKAEEEEKAEKPKAGNPSKPKSDDDNEDSGNEPKSAKNSAGKPEAKTSKEKSPKEMAELQKKFDKQIREMMEKGDLELGQKEIEEFGGPLELGKMMQKFEQGLNDEDRDKLFKLLVAETKPERLDPKKLDPEIEFPIGEEFFRNVLNSFHPSVEAAEKATHYVFRGNDWRSFCTVIHEDGWALTKASEIETKNNQKLNVLIKKGKLVPAKVIKTFDEHDIALLKLEKIEGKLDVVNFTSATKSSHPLGAVIAAVGTGPDPVAIGVISVQPRTLASDKKGFLGVGPGPHAKGVQVRMVGKDTAAEKSGVRVGDVITKINDTVCDTPEKLLRVLQNYAPGTEITVHYLRDEKSGERKVKLGDRRKADAGRPEPNGFMNEFGTSISKRATGFANVLQTDMPITPEQCGGPAVDLDGNIIGLNISRAGRVKTYIVPGSVINELIDGEIRELIEKPESNAKPASEEKTAKSK